MHRLVYKLKDIPDLSLIKYQSLSDNGVDGILKRMTAFLRQWQKISSRYNVVLQFLVRYLPEAQIGKKLNIYLSFICDVGIDNKIYALVDASPIAEFFNMELLTKKDDGIFSCSYLQKAVLVKAERKRICDKSDNNGAIPLFYVESFKTNDEARLYELYKTMHSLNEDVCYSVTLFGDDSYDNIYNSLEKPISFLRNKTANHFAKDIQLNKDAVHQGKGRDIAAEETLKIYEEFIKNVSNSPCYKANIAVLANDRMTADLLLNTVCGEAVEEGTWSVYQCDKKQYSAFSNYEEYNTIMPNSLSYWPTYFTLEEVAPFFKFPALYEGEHIEINKETEPIANKDGLLLGKDMHNTSVKMPIGLLKKHSFICGVPGAGKTNTMLHLCYSLWNEFHVPFLVLEPAKKEYRALAQTDIDELIVFSPASGSRFPLAINPFEFAIGMSLAEHIQNLMDVFEGAFLLTPPLPALLDRAIENVYLTHGWDTDDVNNGDKEYPTMHELYARLEQELKQTDYDGEVRGNMKSALEMRIGGLLRRDLGNVFDVKKSTFAPEELMKYPIIIEMESLGTGPSNFLTLMLCTLIREVLRVNPSSDNNSEIRHILFIEEAHNLIASETDDVSGDDANPKLAATNFIVRMLAEVRALNEGIIIADQLPTAMAAEILKNTGLKIVHRLTAEDDRGLVGSTMSANSTQLEELASYMPGNALITYEGLLRPFKMQISAFKYKDAPSNNQLYELMKVREKQCDIAKRTLSIRLEKYKDKWKHEWDIALVVYQKLLTDAKAVQVEDNIDNISELIGHIVKDQIGLNKCFDILQTIIKKYNYTLDLSISLDDDDRDFLKSMEKGLSGMLHNSKIILKQIRE